MLRIVFKSGLTAEQVEVIVGTDGLPANPGSANVLDDVAITGMWTQDEVFLTLEQVEEAVRTKDIPDTWQHLYLDIEDSIGSAVLDFEYVPSAEDLLLLLLEDLSIYNGRDMLDGYLNALADRYNKPLTLMNLPTIVRVGEDL